MRRGKELFYGIKFASRRARILGFGDYKQMWRAIYIIQRGLSLTSFKSFNAELLTPERGRTEPVKYSIATVLRRGRGVYTLYTLYIFWWLTGGVITSCRCF